MADDHYELVVDAARLPVWEYDVASNTVTGNIYWHRMLGYEPTGAEAKQRVETWLSDVHPDDVARFERIFSSNAADSTGFYETEFRIRTASGTYKWLLERGRVVERDANSAPLRVIGISVDIDSRKRMENALRASEQQLRVTIEASAVPFALNDEHGNITLLNPAFVRTFGYAAADIPTLSEWWTCAYPDPVYRRWVEHTWASRREASLRTGSAFEPMEVVIRCKDGSNRTVVAHAAELAGVPAGTHLVILLDVTEQRRLEKAILAATSREQQRIGMDLHDGLGQQLTGLSLMLTALARSSAAADFASLKHELATLATVASECVSTARAIAHGLSPVELGSGGFERALHRLAESTARTSGLDVAVKATGFAGTSLEESITVPMFRIVQEALTNVAKHARATRVQVEAQLAADTLALTVADDGCGIADLTGADGFGISIMRYRVRALGGQIEIVSPESGGTTVRCTCRLRATDETAPLVLTGAAATPGSRRL